MRQVALLHSVIEGDTFVAVSWQQCQEARIYIIIDCLVPSWRTLELREKRGLDSTAELFVELSWLVWDAEDVRSSSWRRPVSPSSHCLALHWFRSRVGRSGVGLQLGQVAVVRAFLWCSVAALSRSSGEVRGRSQTGEQREWLFRNPFPWCQSVVAPACVASRPRSVSEVRGGSTCGPSTLWRSEVAMLVVRRPSHVVAWWSP
ncbi:hypothetical protein Taro_047789 [Colocasia esculenta]|uniref:Uncharacterized protein n=1 Tax=Colocasia esculenta TaxID=4460 RepID=A0A843X7G0_COLES|nr:hypothetical protein [Colocasia esculenta]